jgi:hypothetical protein
MEGFSSDFNSASAESINRTRLAMGMDPTTPQTAKPGPGVDYLWQVVDARTQLDQDNNRGFFLDFVVLEGGIGASAPGTEFSYVWYPDQSAKFKKKKEGELKRQTGACYGYDPGASTEQVTLEVIASTFIDRGSRDRPLNHGVTSPLRGRVVRGHAKPVWSKKSQCWVPVYEVRPYLEGGQIVDRPIAHSTTPAAGSTASTPASTSAPSSYSVVTPPPAPALLPAAPAIPSGWAPHTDAAARAAGWIYELANPANMKQLRAA